MKKRMIWLLVSCLMTAALLLASCAPAAPPEEKPTPAPPTPEKPAPVVEKPAPPVAEKEMVKIRLTKLDGTVVEKSIEKPKYGGLFNYTSSVDTLGFDDCFWVQWRTFALNWTHDKLIIGNWALSGTGTGEASFWPTVWTDPKLVRDSVAESWEFPDERTIIWHIRKGVRFHNKPPANGREVTAQDVVFSIKRWYGPPTGPKTAFGYTASKPEDRPVSVEATDKYTVVVKYGPTVRGANAFWSIGGYVRVIPPELIEKYGDMRDWKVCLGTGPFLLKDYVAGSSMTLVRNPNYWMKDPLLPENQLPYIDVVKFLVIPDISTRLAALRTAKSDWDWVGREEKESVTKTNPELKYKARLATSPMLLAMRTDTKPFDDIRVRKALSMAIDRDAIIRDYYKGDAEKFPYPTLKMADYSSIRLELEELPKAVQEVFEYNPAKAKQLLAEAGYPKGFKTVVETYSGYVDFLSIIKSYFAAIGVDMELKVSEFGVWESIRTARAHKQMIYLYTAASAPFGLTMTNPLIAHNGSIVDNPRMNEARELFADLAGVDEARRAKLYKELVPYELEQCWYVIPPDPYTYIVWPPWVKGYDSECSVGYGWYYNFHQFIWIDQDLKEKMTGKRD